MEDKVWNKIESRTLVYGGAWEDAQSTIRATVFGVMVELGRDRIKHYRSDLYHDALWINEQLIGPMQFEWIARESGTHIGEVTRYIKDEDWPQSVRYRFDIREDGNQKWVLDIYEAGSKNLGAKYRDAMQEEFLPYFSNEPLSESVKESVANRDVDPIKAMIDSLFERGTGNIPTLRNESTIEPQAQRKENNMEAIIRDLREKYDEASNSKDQLEEYQGNINDAVDELDTYMSDLDDLISSLDQLPEVSVYVDLDTVSFDS